MTRLALRIHILWIAAIAFLISMPSTALAATLQNEQAEKLLPGPMVLPLARPGGEILPAGLFALMNHFSFARYKPFKHASSYTMRVNTPIGEMKVGPKSADQFVNVFKIRYGITDRWEFSTATPYVDLRLKSHNADNAWKGGLGDTTLFVRYGLKKRSDDSPFSIALDAGATLPTGQTANKEKHLAANAFSAILGGGFSWADHNQRVDLDGRYAVYTEGAHGIRPGDFAIFHAHYAWALSRNFDIGAEAYYRIEQQSFVHGKGRRDGFSEIYAGPKIQFKAPELAYLMVGAAVLFPVHRQYDSMRLSTDTRFEFSVLIAF